MKELLNKIEQILKNKQDSFIIKYHIDCSRFLKSENKDMTIIRYVSNTVELKDFYKNQFIDFNSPDDKWFDYISNIILKHKHKDKYYIMFTSNNVDRKEHYIINHDINNPLTEEELKERNIMIPSYFYRNISNKFCLNIETIDEIDNENLRRDNNDTTDR